MAGKYNLRNKKNKKEKNAERAMFHVNAFKIIPNKNSSRQVACFPQLVNTIRFNNCLCSNFAKTQLKCPNQFQNYKVLPLK